MKKTMHKPLNQTQKIKKRRISIAKRRNKYVFITSKSFKPMKNHKFILPLANFNKNLTKILHTILNINVFVSTYYPIKLLHQKEYALLKKEYSAAMTHNFKCFISSLVTTFFIS